MTSFISKNKFFSKKLLLPESSSFVGYLNNQATGRLTLLERQERIVTKNKKNMVNYQSIFICLALVYSKSKFTSRFIKLCELCRSFSSVSLS
jgi:hypothetical protein